MSNRPIIGVTTDTSDAGQCYLSYQAYAGAIERGGGLPVLIPCGGDHLLIPQYVDLIDGILFTGGDDMDPSRYGQSPHPSAVPMDPTRETFEFALIAEAQRRRLPALGVCFGSQLMNVARGGTLVQFLPDEPREDAIEHRKLADLPPPRHLIKLDPESELSSAIGRSEISVNSYHKQAIRRLGDGLRVIATAPDGIIEAFDDPGMPFFAGVQWHPERLLEEPEHRAPFELLVRRSTKR